jgi:hypothetical protein
LYSLPNEPERISGTYFGHFQSSSQKEFDPGKQEAELEQIAMDIRSFPSMETDCGVSASGLSNIEIQKHLMWSNFNAAAQIPNDSLLNHMKAAWLNNHKIATGPVARHDIDGYSIIGNEISSIGGPNSTIFNQRGQDTSQELSLASMPTNLPVSMTNGNNLDHPLIKNPALQPTPFQESSCIIARRNGQTNDRIPDVRSFLNESLDLLLKDDFLPLEEDCTNVWRGTSLSAFGWSHVAVPTTPKRKEGQFQAASDAKRQRTSAPGSQTSRSPRFRPYQEKQWVELFQELLKFKKKLGHCFVPHTFEENQTLSRWVKRQRYQYKLNQEGRVSTMTDSRIRQLEDIGFVWDSHAASWQERLEELQEYVKENGDCHVPSNYPKNPQLATWVKCQRRQGKLFWNGRASNMTLERIDALNQLGFSWGMRLISM